MIDIPFVSLEGSDLSGKSTLYKELWREIQKANNFDVLLTDRGYFSVLCYGILYNRAPAEILEENFLKWLNKNYVVYITVNQSEILKRYELRSDEDRTLDEILRVKEIYDGYSSKYLAHPNFTTFDPETERVENLVTRIHDLRKRGIFYMANRADTLVSSFGTSFNGTQEILNFTIDVSEDWKYLLGYSLQREDLHSIRNEWSKLEQDSYDFQEAKFARSVETVLCGYRGKKEGLESRKFVFTDEECMSYLHILVRNGDLFVKVQFRSSDVKMLIHDMKEIVRMVIQFSDKTEFVPKKVHFSINIDSLHKYKDKA